MRETMPTAAEAHERAELVRAILELPWLDVSKAAIVADTTESTIRRACAGKNGRRLKHTRLNDGKLIRIAREDLRAWLDHGATTPTVEVRRGGA